MPTVLALESGEAGYPFMETSGIFTGIALKKVFLAG